MSLALGLALAFVAALCTDVVAIGWQRARERGDRLRGVPLAMLLELLGWAPVLLAIGLDDARLALGAVAGAGVGTAVGFRRRATLEG